MRTLAISTDPAHSLADAFDAPLGDKDTELASNLWGRQLDARLRMEESWGEIRSWLIDVFDWAGVDAIEAEELSVLPGLDEVFALADIRTIAASDDWDVLVVDCAPTAETIRLLSLPDVLSWYMDRVFPMTRKMNRLMAPVFSRVTRLPVAGDEVFGAAENFHQRLEGVGELLRDHETASVRLVVNPERMVVAEARRTYTYLCLFGYSVDAVVANRILPDEVDDPWFSEWKDVHKRQMEAIESGFSPLPVLRSVLRRTEPVGLDSLREMALGIYGEHDPARRLHGSAPMHLVHEGGVARLKIFLPFAAHDDLEVARSQNELLVRVGPYRRSIVLPDSLLSREVKGARLTDGSLDVDFG